MTVPGLGELSLSGFQSPWLFVFALVPVGLVTAVSWYPCVCA